MEPNKMIEQKSIALQLVPRGWEVSIFLRVNGVIWACSGRPGEHLIRDSMHRE
jgi:exosome complex RNA-binding protein Rrp4